MTTKNEAWRTPESWDEADEAFEAGVCQQKGVHGWFRIRACPSDDHWNSPGQEYEEYGVTIDQFRIPASWPRKDGDR